MNVYKQKDFTLVFFTLKTFRKFITLSEEIMPIQSTNTQNVPFATHFSQKNINLISEQTLLTQSINTKNVPPATHVNKINNANEIKPLQPSLLSARDIRSQRPSPRNQVRKNQRGLHYTPQVGSSHRDHHYATPYTHVRYLVE